MLGLIFALVTEKISKSISDEEAVREYVSTQNSAYFNILYERYSRKIFAKCLSILKNEEEANDATQDIFMKLILNLSKFGGHSKFSTWVYSISYNYCIDRVRKKKKDISILVEDMSHYDKSDDDIKDKMLLEMNVLRLKEILNKIPVGDKIILLMKYQDSMSIKEIGAVLDKSESAVKMKIKRAKQKFRNMHSEIYKPE